jgi:hypothetical protein
MSEYTSALRTSGWSHTIEPINYCDVGDCIDDATTFIISFHNGIHGEQIKIDLPRPPPIKAVISDFIYTPFESKQYSITLQPDIDGSLLSNDRFKILPSDHSDSSNKRSKIIGYLKDRHANSPTLAGSKIFCRDHPAPPIEPLNSNAFQALFGIHFVEDGKTYTRPISFYEYCCCWQLDKNLIVELAKDPKRLLLLKGAVPSKTSHMILHSVYTKLCALRTSNTTSFDTNAQSAPAATTVSFLNGATSIKLPTPETWKKAYLDDPETAIMADMISNPSAITKQNLLKIHYAYRQPMRERRIILLQNIL